MSEDWITTTEAAEISGYHSEHIRRLLRQEVIQGRKFGPIWQVEQKSLRAHMNRMKNAGKKRGAKPK